MSPRSSHAPLFAFLGALLLLAGCDGVALQGGGGASPRGRGVPDPMADPDGGMGAEMPPGETPPEEEPETCADVSVQTSFVVPTVMLIVDQSGSMNQGFGGGMNRWQAVHQALTGPAGLVTELEDQVRFGAALYSYDEDEDAACPAVVQSAPTIGSFEEIEGLIARSAPRANTPTGESIEAILDSLDVLDSEQMPSAFILATDGNPDRCEDPDGHDAISQRISVEAVRRAYEMGIRTYVIGVGEGTVSADHLRDLAETGAGAAGAPYWEANDVEGLRSALSSIVRGELSCTVELEGSVLEGTECSGTVTLNAEPLECDGEDGWRRVDERHIELLGAACDTFLTTRYADLQASFPCESVLF